jgi:hypothetical protein
MKPHDTTTSASQPKNINQFADNVENRSHELNKALSKLINNPRVSQITIAVSPDVCTSGRNVHGTYLKDNTPKIPVEACSRPGGCNCRYIPILTEIFP